MPVAIQKFSEDNPVTQAALNAVIDVLMSAINGLYGEAELQWSTAAPSETQYAPLSGADFTGLVTAPALRVGGYNVVTVAGGQSVGGIATFNALAASSATVGGSAVFTVAGGQSVAGTTTFNALYVGAYPVLVDNGALSTTSVSCTSLSFSGTFHTNSGTINGELNPSTDNAYPLGNATNRWHSVWAANGTIQTSDGTEKTDIFDSDLGLGFILALRPVSFRWILGGNEVSKNSDGNEAVTPRPGARRHYGLIAQEVFAALDGKDFGGYIDDAATGRKGLRYDQLIAPLIKAVQELEAKKQDKP